MHSNARGYPVGRAGPAGVAALLSTAVLFLGPAVLLVPGVLAGQSRLKPADPPPPPGSGSVVVAAGAEYAAGSLGRFLGGHGYRDLWVTPVRVPVLDLRSFAGGLAPYRRGGHFQSVTLHMRGADGRRYIFRSINKFVEQGLPPDLVGTPAGALIQDQMSSLHPAGAFVIVPLLEAVDVLRAPPRLFVMPDDPALGEFRDSFAGMLGMLHENPDEGEEGRLVTFHGSVEMAGPNGIDERMKESPEHRIDTRNFLAARLVDLVVGDPDRGSDQWRWARYGSEGAYTWRPIPRDRDLSFVAMDGVVARVARAFVEKFVADYGPHWGDLERLWAASERIDRSWLTDLERPAWDSVVVEVQEALSDSVIDVAVARLPDEYQAMNAAFMAGSLRWRRDHLREAADAFYRYLATDVDVHGTDAAEVAVVERHPDGTLEVSLLGPRAGSPRDIPIVVSRAVAQGAGNDGDSDVPLTRYYHRRFHPDETEEVRIHLGGGDDRAVVRGRADRSLTVRILGGAGNDVLMDSSRVAGGSGRTAFYDHDGDNIFVTRPGTRVSERAFDPPFAEGFLARGELGHRDYGSEAGWGPKLGYREGAGAILGAAWTSTDYRFRRIPWGERITVGAFIGLSSGGFGAEVEGARRLENSPVMLSARLDASTDLRGIRFYGFGNDTPALDPDQVFSFRDELTLEASVRMDLGSRGSLSVGPAARWLDPEPGSGSPLAVLSPPGWETYAQVGARAAVGIRFTDREKLPTRGAAFHLGGSAYASVLDAPGWFGGVDAEARGYAPLGVGTLALRGGGRAALGDFPVHEAAFLGGRRTLRGFRYQRLAGDRAVYGGAELRVPVTRVTLLTRGDLGILALADVGRVWMDGASPGGWHAGYGAGLWFATLDELAAHVTYARGEDGRIYAGLGLPF